MTLALILAGCSGDADSPSSPTSTMSPSASATANPSPTATPTASPTPLDEDAAEALQVYQRFWGAVTRARSIPDATLPALATLAADTALTNEQEFLVALEREGVAYRGEPKPIPR